jgi:serine/threonine protein kinase
MPFKESDPIRFFKDVLAGASPEFLNLVENLIIMDPKKRLTVEQALEHSFFDSIRNFQNN